MNSSLHLAREVEVDIGRFVSLEAEEGFKRDFVAVAFHFLAALGAFLNRKVKARAVFAVKEKFAVLTFHTVIMRREGVNLGYTAEVSNERRADRAS